MSLTDQLATMAEQSVNRIPPETRVIMESAIAELVTSGLVASALKTGDNAPDFTLLSASGESVTLSERLKSGPVVLVFYRGQWCPYCNVELRAYQMALEAITEAGGSLIAISPETPDNSLTTAEKNELAYDVLSDVGFEVSDAFGLTFELSPELKEVYAGFGIDLPVAHDEATWRLPIAAAYVIDRDGRVVLHHVEADYKVRLDPADALAALQALNDVGAAVA